MTDLPTIRVKPREDRRLLMGHPWAFANELILDDKARQLAPGCVVDLTSADGRPIGTATFNIHSLIAARLYSRIAGTELNQAFFEERLTVALSLRERLRPGGYYRLIHAEGDGLPGFVVDRFGDIVVVQANSAGAENLLPIVVAALDSILGPKTIVLRNDSPIRALERLDLYVRLAKGRIDGPVAVRENGLEFLADVLEGQKTGWFFDLGPARAAFAALTSGGRMLDVYCHSGAFAISAAAAGAAEVLAIDRSDQALALARAAATANGVADKCSFRRADAFDELERLAGAGERFAALVADPPSFVKSRKELKSGSRGYRKLTKLAAELIAAQGFLFIASCSHHVERALFAEEVARGLAAAGRTGRILSIGGAGPDHPVHPMLPESAYLKYQILQLD